MSELKNRPLPEDLALPLQGVDTHAHLDMPELKEDIPEILDQARRTGVEFVGNVFLGPKAYADHRALFAHDPQVFFLLGMHPHEAQNADDFCLDQIQSAMQEDERIKALGEIGLDYFRNYAPHAVQKKAFKAQLQLAKDMDMPVVIHSRAAEEETLHILDQAGFARRSLLWHCFGGGPDLAEEILQRGWQISIPGTVTFSKAKALHKTVQILPPSSMVLETDCPFLTPEPYRGKRNEPAMTVFTARKVAELRDEDVLQVWERTGRNAREFFGLRAGGRW
ncbi:MAG: TatD family hydrolase [Desulfovermiculus sp.]|nr:TatD family hydrolase [Desulfovermiculus sp.]